MIIHNYKYFFKENNPTILYGVNFSYGNLIKSELYLT